jgi:hypothetical protein
VDKVSEKGDFLEFTYMWHRPVTVLPSRIFPHISKHPKNYQFHHCTHYHMWTDVRWRWNGRKVGR